jgi:hypothetical protein
MHNKWKKEPWAKDPTCLETKPSASAQQSRAEFDQAAIEAFADRLLALAGAEFSSDAGGKRKKGEKPRGSGSR